MLETGYLIFETKPEKKFSILHHFFAFYLFCMHFHTADTLSIMSVTFCLLCQWNASGSDFLKKSQQFPHISSHQKNWNKKKWDNFGRNLNLLKIRLSKTSVLICQMALFVCNCEFYHSRMELLQNCLAWLGIFLWKIWENKRK